MRILTALFLTSFIFLTGCASLDKPLPKIEMQKSDKIGFLIETKDLPVHTHVGTTVFNNFSKPYSYDWRLREEVNSRAKSAIIEAGFQAQDLTSSNLSAADISKLIVYKDNSWQVAPDKADLVKRLRQELNLKGVLVARQARVLVEFFCTQFGCVERYSGDSGLYTRSFFGFDRYFGVAAFEWDLVILDPVANLNSTKLSRDLTRVPVIPIEKFNPTDFKELTESEMNTVKASVLNLVEKTAKELLKPLAALPAK